MATEKGLAKFNGHTLKTFYHKADSSGLLPFPIYAVFIDKAGMIWISYMEACISKFDPLTEKFTHYYHDPKNPKSFPYGATVQFLESSKGELWMAVWGGGLCKVDRAKGEFVRYGPVKGDSTIINTTEITSLAEMKDGKLLVGTWESGNYGGQAMLQIFDPVTTKASYFPYYDYKIESNNTYRGVRSAFRIVHFIHIDEKNDYWIGSYLGLYHIDNKKKEIRRYSDLLKKNTYDNKTGGIENASYCLQSGDKLWVGTEVTGIMVVDMNTGATQTIRHENDKIHSLSGDNILGLFKDEEENVWVSTKDGVDVYTPLLQQFKFLSNRKLQAEKENKSQGINSVNNVLVASNGKVYFSHGNGVTIYDPLTDSIETIITSKFFTKDMVKQWYGSNPNLVRLALETKHHYLFQQWGTILTIDKKTGKGKYLNTDFNYASIGLDTTKNEILIGSHLGVKTKGFEAGHYMHRYKMDDLSLISIHVIKAEIHPDVFGFEEGLFRQLDNENWIVHMNKKSFGVYNSRTEKLKVYGARKGLNEFPDSMIRVINVDKNKMAWIRASAGIYKFDYRNGKSTLFNDSIGINKEYVACVRMDENNQLWFALSIDVIKYDPKTKERFRFTSELGLNNGAFADVRNCGEDSKRLYFIGSYGVTYFDPEKLIVNKKKPGLFLVNLILNGDTLSEIKKDEYLINGKKLEWNKNFITFEFSTSQHYNPGQKSYSYRLVGLDTNWYKNESRNYVSYTNLSHGSYTFELRYVNSYHVESNVYRIPFVIDKPIWLKWWFILLEVITVVGLIFFYIRKRERKLTDEKIKLEAKVEERTSELVEKAKQVELQSTIINEKNKELTDSIKYARRIQGTLLANLEFMQANLPDHFVLFKPKDIVSGDFYWATKIEAEMSEFVPGAQRPNEAQDDLFYFAVCDSTGHGVPGAFMSLLNISYLNEAIGEKKMRTTNSILNYVRQKLINNLSADGAQDGMDGTLVCYNKAKNILTYSSAHNKPILIREGHLSELPADKMPIGKGERTDSFHLNEIKLLPGDIIYFYTDGFADQFGGPKGKKFKYRQLNELLLKISSMDLQEQYSILSNDFDNWKGKLEQVDDVLLIGIKF